MIIAVDFDGTIVDHRYPDIGAEVPGALSWIKQFQAAGAKVFLWTMRSDGVDDGNTLTEAISWLAAHDVWVDGANINPEQTWSRSPKLYANLYIDDAAFGCPLRENPRSGGRPYVDWDVVGPRVLSLLQSRAAAG